MKSKVGKIFIFTLMICSLMFLLPLNGAYALDTTDEVEGVMLITSDHAEDNIYKSNQVAGVTTGYGAYVLNSENVTLYSTSNDGFKIAGWQITYSNNATLFIDADEAELGSSIYSQTNTIATFDNLDDITATITYTTDSNGNKTYSEFTLSKIYENLTVDPIYEYVYLNVEVPFASIIGSFTDYSSNILNDAETLLFKSSETENGVTTYSNAYIVTSGNYYYYEHLYSESVADNDSSETYTKYYTLHKNTILTDAGTQEEKSEKVDYLLGAYRIDDTVTYSLDIAISDSISDSVNIDLLAAYVSADDYKTELSDAGDVNYFSVTQDDYLRTASLSIVFSVQSDDTLINTLTVDYHNLYVVTLSTYVDNEEETEDIRELILGVVTLDNYYSKVTDTQYLVKTASDNSNNSFAISLNSTITKTIDGKTYSYYSFDSLDDESNLRKNYSSITDDFDVKISYTSIEYTISFVFAVYENSSLTTLNGYNVENSQTLTRGKSVTISKTDASNNTGFEFYGFALNAVSIQSNTSITIDIDNDKPTNYTIYMVYKYIDYTITITNYDKITLTDTSNNTIYPISAASLTVVSGSYSYVYTFDATSLRNNNSLTFSSSLLSCAIKLNNTVQLTLTLNNGFYIAGFNLSGNSSLIEENGNVYSFTITQDMLNQYATDGNLTIYIYEDYSRYTSTYYINTAYDTTAQENVVMADIDVEVVYSEGTDKYANITKSFTEGDEVDYTTTHTIIISNLKLYDVVNLIAVGRTIENDDEEEDSYSYAFVKFTENGIISLSYSYDEEKYSYTHSLTITRDNMSIRVVYTMFSSSMSVSLNADAYILNGDYVAYDLSNISFVNSSNETMSYDTSSYTVDVTNETITVTLTGDVAFGFSFVGYTYTVNGSSSTVTVSGNSFSLTTVGSSTQELVLNFVKLSYRLTVSQYGAGTDGDKLNFGTSDNPVDYTELDVDNLTLSFIKPTGYYIDSTYFVANNESTLYSDICENNGDYNKYVTTFNHTFTIEELNTIIESYGTSYTDYVQADMIIYYAVYTFNVTVRYDLTNAKNNSYDLLVSYPQITLTYIYSSTSETLTGTYTTTTLNGVSYKSVIFYSVPYGSSVTLNVVGDIPVGFSAATAWTDDTDSKLNSPYSYTTYQLTFSSITNDETFKYKLDYLSYELSLVYDNAGSPYVTVNGTESTSVTMFDSFSVYTEANKSSGFMFVNLYYYKEVYSLYTYDESTWTSLAMSLYVLNGSTYELNTSYEYNSTVDYYTCEDVKVEFSSSTTYTDSMFNASNYKIEDRSINIYIEYDYIQITLSNKSGLYNDSPTLVKSDLNIVPEEFVTYTMFVVTDEGEDELGEGDTVTYLDQVIIRIKFNTATVSGETYDLSRGLKLINIAFLNYYSYSFDSLTDSEYDYQLVLNVSYFVSDVPNSGEVTIYYYYFVQQFSVTLTTNINSSSFYYTSSGRKFNMQADALAYGGSVTTTESSTNSTLTYSFQFLGKVVFSYNFANSNYSDYFRITGVRVYVDGVLVEDYAYYGVYPQYDGDGEIKSINVRYVQNNVTIKLIVQPTITFNGDYEIIDGDYYFSTVYSCTSALVGNAQQISFGTTSSYQIQTSEFLYYYLSISYIDSNSTEVSPTDVGTYTVNFAFSASNDDAWIEELTLDYTVYFVITQRNIYLDYSSISSKIEKTYDGISEISTSYIMQYLVITDNAGISVYYSQQNSFSLSSGLLATITYTDNNEEVATARANESTYYNIYLTNIAFIQSSVTLNFNLVNSSLVISSVVRINQKALDVIGISANDKVYDGTTDVTISDSSSISLSGLISDDEVNLLTDNLTLAFINAEVGANKTITISALDALYGADASNYKLNEISSVSASIYPYKVSTYVDGLGEVTIINKRGLTDLSMVDLIPIGATLQISTFSNDSQEYINLYNKISNYITSGKVFAIGMVLNFEQNGISLDISNDLYISIPKIDKMTSLVYLTGDYSGELVYDEQGDYILVDLSQFEAQVNTLIVVKQRVLLKAWQIVLIVVLFILLIALVIAIVIVVRRKRVIRYSSLDQI